jgi:two-component system cell cycle sensor histidine kinase/response regulator CckA
MRELIELNRGKVMRRIPLLKGHYRLGRGPENDIVFDVARVSREHAVLAREEDTYTIVDQDSRNHVLVNGERVKKKKLTSGDKINLSPEVSLLYLAESDSGEEFERILGRLSEFYSEQDFVRLKQVTQRIISLDSLENILKGILAEVVALVKAERGFIALTDDQGELQVEHSVRHNIALDDKVQQAFSQSIVRRAIHQRESVVVLNTAADTAPSDSILALNLRAVMCAPLLFGDKLVGVLYVDSGTQVADFNTIDQFFFTMLADNAAIAIENAKLYQQIQQLNQQLTTDIQETETRYRQLIDYSPEAIIVHNQGQVLFVNQAAVKLFGAEKPSDLVNGSVLDRVHPDYRGMVMQRIRQEETGQLVPPLEEKFLRLDGSAVDVEVLGAPFVYQGKPTILVMARDITTRKRMEQALFQAQRLESVGVLAGGIAHDFNNILQVIRGNALMAQVNLDDGDNVQFCLTAIEKAVAHAVSLTSQLLTFSKGGAPITRSTSIEALLEESAAFVLRGSKTAYTLDFAPNLYFVEVDSEQINQVIHNLVLNAEQAMPHGGVITISAANVEIDTVSSELSLKPGPYVKIAVKDQGLGMAEDVLERAFDPYFTTKKGGSGLGLSSCYSIISRHGGTIKAESVEGQGSIFTFYLPASNQQPEEGKTGGYVGRFKGKVLLMDDDEMVQDTARRMLAQIGCQVEVAADGAEAIARYFQAQAAGQPFDLVIFDLTVPGGLGGQEAIEQLRQHVPHLKAIVASGYNHDPVLADPGQYGFQRVILKPFNLDELAQTMDDLMSKA